MPYKRHKPISEEEMEQGKFDFEDFIGPQPPAPLEDMNKHRWDGHHTVCQTLREIYRMTNDPEIKLKCRLAMAMTKAMHEKLKEYKNGNAIK